MVKKQYPLTTRLIQEAAKSLGLSVYVEKEWGYIGYVLSKNGKKIFFKNKNVDVNLVGAYMLARDKMYTKFFLEKAGFFVPNGKAFFSKEKCKAIHSKDTVEQAFVYAKKIGLPVIVKPNSQSLGLGVAKVYTKKEFNTAASFIFLHDDTMLVEEFFEGRDYRVVVLDSQVMCTYERIPFSVVGDGKKNLQTLLNDAQKTFEKNNRRVKLDMKDFRMQMNLLRKKIKFSTVLLKGERIVLLDNANLSSGGSSVDVSNFIHADFKKIAIAAAKEMNLTFCGVDIMVKNSINQPCTSKNSYKILEVNATPGLDNYFSMGKSQQMVVKDIYKKLLDLGLRK